MFFDLTKPTWIHLTGFLVATDYADAELQLEDPNFDLLFDLFVTDGGMQELDEKMFLQGVADLLELLASWGPCTKGCCLTDLDVDDNVGVPDLLALLANWGLCP